MKKVLGVIICILLVCTAGLCGYALLSQNDAPTAAIVSSVSQPVSSVSEPEPEPVVSTLHFSATGDNLIHDGLYLQAAARAGGTGYDFTYLYQNIASFYLQYDINWINQETLVTDEYAPAGYPCFCSPAALGEEVYNVGWRVISMSNNHSYDKGAGGITATQAFWDNMPDDVVTTGEWRGESDYDTIPVQEIGGIKIAYLAYTEHTNGLPTPANAEANVIYTNELDVIQHQIEVAKQKADLVFVGVHMGVEGSHTTTEAQAQWFQQVADWGADCIIGTHPHVIQNMDWLDTADGRSVPVAYSLGNFANLQSSADNLVGIVMTLDIQITTQPDGTVSDILLDNLQAVPVVMQYDSGYTNGRVYLYADYTDELAAQHGIRGNYPSWSLDYIRSVLEDNISAEYLVLESPIQNAA